MKTLYFDWQKDIKLFQLLKKTGICITKSEAKELIDCGTVLVNNVLEADPNASIYPGDTVEFDDIKIRVE